MNEDLKDAFSKIKPVCDIVMVYPSADSIKQFLSCVSELKKEVIQELQQYILFPFITHVKSTEIEKKYELQCRMVDAMKSVLERVKVTNYEMFMTIETALIGIVFDNTKSGMVAEIPEELKLSVMKCLTVLMLNVHNNLRLKFLKTQIPMLAQAVFVSVHIAKLEKLRALRLAGIKCVTAFTVTHPQFTNNKYQLLDTSVEAQIVDVLASILPGLLAALQDVATCTDNPGHAVVVASLDAIHRILCLTMNDKFLKKKTDVTLEDFAKMMRDNAKQKDDIGNTAKSPKDVTKRSPEWYKMAGDKLTLITKSVASLRTHEHFKVRRELAVFCSRLLFECNTTMQQSVPLALDILICLSKDEYPAVAQYCEDAVRSYFATSPEHAKHDTLDILCDNFVSCLTTLPRILNNIDSSRKLSSLNLLHGYIEVLCAGSGLQRVSATLSARDNLDCLCMALLEAAAVRADLTLLTRQPTRDVSSSPPTTSPWCRLRHLDDNKCEVRLQQICQLLGGADCAGLVADRLLEMFQRREQSEIVYVLSWMGTAPSCPTSLVKRILDTYLEEGVWYLPLEVGDMESPVTTEETLDVSLYNPRAWVKESVPDLYEGAVETRYTDISYQTPRTPRPRDPTRCSSLAEGQNNMVLSCLLTEGVGMMAKKLLTEYQPYLLKTLCMILERVSSNYEMLHLAGLKAISDVAFACGHDGVADLIRSNADYFTYQVTQRLKKAWNSQSALQILSVVMEYSDHSILDCLYGIVQDVLVQSCDKYYSKDLSAYLKVFLTFVNCIKKWFPTEEIEKDSRQDKKIEEIDVFKELAEYLKNKDEAERLQGVEEFEKDSAKSVEEMFKEDMEKKEENLLDYDDRVTNEKPPLPQHVTVTITVLKRCLNFIPSKNRDEAILALEVLNFGLPILRQYEDELLPLVHLVWSPLVTKFESGDPVVLIRALDLLVTMADLSKDFIRSRTVKEVFPNIYKYLQKSSNESYLKDAGSFYRSSAAYRLQTAVLTALPNLVVDLCLEGDLLQDTLTCVEPYLSNKQPKPLQNLAVIFYKVMLDYDDGATWHKLRQFCDNECILIPPAVEDGLPLDPVQGSPYEPKNKDYQKNISLVFNREI